MAKGDFIWFLGDDDLLVKNAIDSLTKILEKKKCEFIWINSFHLDSKFLKKYPYPFNTKFTFEYDKAF